MSRGLVPHPDSFIYAVRLNDNLFEPQFLSCVRWEGLYLFDRNFISLASKTVPNDAFFVKCSKGTINIP